MHEAKLKSAKPAHAGNSAKRDAILDTATALFLDVGYGATSINMLVAKVGGSKSTVYAHFANKEKLFEAVVDGVLRELLFATTNVDAANVDTGGRPLREGLALIGERLLNIVVSERHIALARMVIAEARRFPEIGRIYYEHGPVLAHRSLAAFIALHQREAETIGDVEEAALWFSSRLVHRGFVEQLCCADRAVTKAALAREVNAAVDGFFERFGG